MMRKRCVRRCSEHLAPCKRLKASANCARGSSSPHAHFRAGQRRNSKNADATLKALGHRLRAMAKSSCTDGASPATNEQCFRRSGLKQSPTDLTGELVRFPCPIEERLARRSCDLICFVLTFLNHSPLPLSSLQGGWKVFVFGP